MQHGRMEPIMHGRMAPIMAVMGSVMMLGCVPLVAWADTDAIADLKSQMTAMEQRHQEELAQLQARLLALEASRSGLGKEESQAPAGLTDRLGALEQKVSKVPGLERFANITWYGDFRLRLYDGIYNLDSTASRHRARGRLRLGLTYPAAEHLEFGARLSTGGSTGDSGYATLGDRFSKDDFQLDRYYVRYRPIDALDLVAGKFENPFWVTQATWDVDLQPEGAAATYTWKHLGPIDQASVRAGFFTVSELEFDNDATMVGGQVVASKKLAKDWSLQSGLANYTYRKVSPASVVSNATNAQGGFLSDFKEIDSVSELSYTGWTWPLAVLWEYEHNFGAAHDVGDDLYAVEARMGKIKQVRDWELKYSFARIEQDAVLADFAGNETSPETNMTAHGLYATMRVLKNTDLGMSYMMYRRNKVSTAAATDEHPFTNRLRLDVTVKF